MPILEHTNYDLYVEMVKMPGAPSHKEIVKNLQIKMSYINSRYTDMQLAVRLSFMFLSLGVCIVYLCKMCRLPRHLRKTSD